MKIFLRAGLAAMFLASFASHAAYPEKPIRLIVPFGAGTSTDMMARVIGESLSRQLSQTVVIENKPGAGGSIGADFVAKSRADGYTLGMGTVGTFAINKALFSRLAYDPSTDFTYLGMPGYTPTLLVVGKDSPYATLKDLLDDAARKDGKVAFASAGNGTSGHLAGELLKKQADVSMLHVPYKEGAQGLTDTISGQVAFMFYHPAAVVPHIQSGALKALAASAARRSVLAPDVPTVAESGYPDFDLTAWYMLAAPAGLPEDTRATLLEATEKAMRDPAVREVLGKQGVEGEPLPLAELAGFVEAEISKWSEVVEAANARVD